MAEVDLDYTDTITCPETETISRRHSRLEVLWQRIFPVGFSVEFIEVFKLAWPSVITSLFQSLLQTVSIIMCGHLAKYQLDAVGLANSIINIFGISIGMGMSTACDTFFSQTFGSKNKLRVGVYLQRSLIIMNTMALLICCVHINIQPILILLGQDIEISKMTSDYMLRFLPGVFCDFNFLVVARYLQNQNIVFPSLVCAFIGNIFNVVSQYVSIHVLGFSYLASAVCQATSLFIMMFTQIIYVIVSKAYKRTWGGFNHDEALREWGMFFKLAISGLFMVGLEEWSFEIAIFVAGTINAVELGIQSIMFQIEAITYMLPLGVSMAVNIRVGQHLGGSQPEHAKTTFRVGLALIIMTSTIMGILMLTLRDYIPYIFTNEKSIAQGVSSILILIVGFQYGDGIAGTASGALRGCGRQFTGAIILFIGYYVVSLPIGISLALATDWKVFGLWTGLLVGIVLEATIFVIAVCRTDWHKQCHRAAMVAYGRESKREEISEINEAPEAESEQNDLASETEPLLRRRDQGVRRSSMSFSRRTVLSASDLENITEIQDSREPFRRVLMKRAIFAVFALAWMTAAVLLRVFQVTPCYPVNNSTMPDYIGVLPLCNETSV